MLVDNSTNIYAGQTEIIKAYQGSNVIYEKEEPLPYTPISYIKSTGTQWINTEFVATNNTKVEIDLSHITGDDCPVYSASTEWNAQKYILTSQDGQFHWWYAYKATFGSIGSSTRFLISTYRNVVMVNDQATSYTDSTNRNITSLTNIYIFATPNQQRSPNKFRLYSFKVWDNDILVRDMIPVLDSQYIPCLYDKVGKKFYYNAGSGNFNYGTK